MPFYILSTHHRFNMSAVYPTAKQVKRLVYLSQQNRKNLERAKKQLKHKLSLLYKDLYNVEIKELNPPKGFEVNGVVGPYGFEGDIYHDVEPRTNEWQRPTKFFYRYGHCVNREVDGQLIYNLDTPELRPCEYIERFIELVGQRGKDRPDLLASIESTSQQISKLNGELYYDRYH